MDLAPYIELTFLSPTLTIRDIDRCVDEGREHHFCAVTVPPFWVKRAKREIGTTPISLVTVAGFPFGYNMTETKLDEIKRGFENGADEIDVVMNVTSLKTGIPWTKIEIAKCAKLCHDHQKLLTVTVEISNLSSEEIFTAAKICSDAGADFIKTSTGFVPGVITPLQIKSIRHVLPPGIGIKVFGIQTPEEAHALLDAGVDRVGITSASNFITTTTPTTHE